MSEQDGQSILIPEHAEEVIRKPGINGAANVVFYETNGGVLVVGEDINGIREWASFFGSWEEIGEVIRSDSHCIDDEGAMP
jgi:hypothetical protein